MHTNLLKNVQIKLCRVLSYSLPRTTLNSQYHHKQHVFNVIPTSIQISKKRFYSNTSSADKLIVIEQIGNIRTIGINRPEKKNCINSATAKALLEAFQDFDDDENTKVAVLYGVGGNFCAGYDLEEVSTTTDNISTLSEEKGPMGPTRYETSKPVIAAIDGYAVAGGLELALWCDMRIIDETAIMGVFCRRFGVPLIDGGTYRLPQMIGMGRALDMILTGRPVKAPEAIQYGLASQVVSCGCALGRAVYQAEGLVRYPQEALKADRYSARKASSFTSIQEALAHEHRRGLEALVEAKKGATNFVKGEGRHGSFKGEFSVTETKQTSTGKLIIDLSLIH